MSSPKNTNSQSPAVTDRRRNLARDTMTEAMEFAHKRGPFLRHMISQTASSARDVAKDRQLLALQLKSLSESFPGLEIDSAGFEGDDLIANEIGFLHQEAAVSQEARIIQEKVRVVSHPHLLTAHYRTDQFGRVLSDKWTIGSHDGLHGMEAMEQLFGASSEDVKKTFRELLNAAHEIATELNARTRTRFITRSGAQKRGVKNLAKLLAHVEQDPAIIKASAKLQNALDFSNEVPWAERRELLVMKTNEIDKANQTLFVLRNKEKKLDVIRTHWRDYFATDEGAEKALELQLEIKDPIVAAIELDALIGGAEHVATRTPEDVRGVVGAVSQLNARSAQQGQGIVL